jgi:WD40 repeat protein
MKRVQWLLMACFGLASAATASAQEVLSHRRLMMNANTCDVWALAFSPDGKTLAAGRSDGGITLWDVATEKARVTLDAHKRGIHSVAFSPDGKTLASASRDKTIRLWNVATGKNVATLEGREDVVRCVAFSPDGKTLASACGARDKTVKLWDMETGRNTRTFPGAGFLSVAFSPDGKTLAASCFDKTIRLWDAKTGKSTATLTGRDPFVYSVAFSPDGKTLASGGDWNSDTPSRLSDVKTLLWDVRTGKTIRILQGDDAVRNVAFSPDGKTLALATLNYRIQLWDVATGKRVAADEHAGPAVAFSPDGKMLATSGYEDEQDGGSGVYLWDVKSAKDVK